MTKKITFCLLATLCLVAVLLSTQGALFAQSPPNTAQLLFLLADTASRAQVEASVGAPQNTQAFYVAGLTETNYPGAITLYYNGDRFVGWRQAYTEQTLTDVLATREMDLLDRGENFALGKTANLFKIVILENGEVADYTLAENMYALMAKSGYLPDIPTGDPRCGTAA